MSVIAILQQPTDKQVAQDTGALEFGVVQWGEEAADCSLLLKDSRGIVHQHGTSGLSGPFTRTRVHQSGK